MKIKEIETYCSKCENFTKSIVIARATFICEGCGNNKTMGDLYQYKLRMEENRK